MIVPDTKILVHAYNSDSPRHAPARAWWEPSLTRPCPVGMPWATVLGFIRIMTSVITSKPATHDHFKTGQRTSPRTEVLFYHATGIPATVSAG